MMSSVLLDLGEDREELRFTTRAMMRVETELNQGIMTIAEGLETDFKVSTIVALLEASGGDGKGIDRERALDLLDIGGVVKVTEVIGLAIEKAFPDPEEGGGKKGKAAGRSK